MSDAWSALAESRIQEAIRNGEFDDLPGRGKPIDLTEYFRTPLGDRVGHSILKTAGVLPVEVELFREIGRLETAMQSSQNSKERLELEREIQAKRVSLAVILEKRQHTRRGDASLEPNW